MKNFLILLVSALFVGILAFNVTIGNSQQVNDISLKNTEALACYSVEYYLLGINIHKCCEPWDYTCDLFGDPGVYYWQINNPCS